jgi:hypothetical protein
MWRKKAQKEKSAFRYLFCAFCAFLRPNAFPSFSEECGARRFEAWAHAPFGGKW